MEDKPNQPAQPHAANLDEDEIEQITLEVMERITKIVGDRQDITERKLYANKIFTLVCFWLIIVLAMIVVASGWPQVFHLSDTVILGLLSSTTVSVVGLFAIVASYLFPKK